MGNAFRRRGRCDLGGGNAGELPRSYSVSEVAAFSRWYLKRLSGYGWMRSDGLLVVGFPKGSVFKYNLSNDMKDVYVMLKGAAAVFLMNLICWCMCFC